jgi:hypothetical protein
MHHPTSNSVIEILTDTDAIGHQGVLAVTKFLDGRTLLSSGQYADRYTRCDGAWAIAECRAAVIAAVEFTWSPSSGEAE